MKTRIGTLAVLLIALACVPALAAPAKVKLRVEGATHTIFEGAVTTNAHQVTTDASGAHPCDGTNGGAHPTPGPTATGALDDGTKLAEFDWDGSWSDSFQDFLVNRIGPDTSTQNSFWEVIVQGKPLQVGGCQFQVASGEEVLWALVGTNGKHILELSGPRHVRQNKAFLVRVIDGQDGKPVAGAKVGKATTNAAGRARLRFRALGTRRLKARKADSVRSNQLQVKVLPKHR